MKIKSIGLLMCLSVSFSMAAVAQDPAKIWLREGPYKLLDTEEIQEQMTIARNLAGDDYYHLNLQRLQCGDVDETGTVVRTPGANTLPQGPQNVNGWAEKAAIPTQVFDNVYYIGGMEVGGWLIDTGDGYIMLDSSYDYGAESILLPNMAKLGLDPAKIKYILITHAGPDHIGAAKYFQDNFGTEIVFNSSLGRPFGDNSNTAVATIYKDGDTLTLGDTTITMVETPRTVGGSGLSYLIPVSINGRQHTWATFGNSGLVGTVEDKNVYRESMAHFVTYVDHLGADIAISSHPFLDASLNRMEAIRECDDQDRFHGKSNRKQCSKNPFLIGKREARRYFEIMDQCAVVQIKRQEAGLNESGLGYLSEAESMAPANPVINE